MNFLLTTLIATIPIPIVEYGPDYTEINMASQLATKEQFPWWWEKYGCEGTQWYGPEPCKDLTE